MDREYARTAGGELLLGRREHVTSSRPGTTHGAYAHHAIVDQVSACSGALICRESTHPVSQVDVALRCRRPACRVAWRDVVNPIG